MCRIRCVHFTLHDVAPSMATNLFNTNGEGDYRSSGVARQCRCGHSKRMFSLEPMPLGSHPQPEPNHCFYAGYCFHTYHDCCVLWYQVIECNWFWESLEADSEWDCPNRFISHRYCHLHQVLEPESRVRILQKIGLPEDVPRWDLDPPKPPHFPADLFYSPDQWPYVDFRLPDDWVDVDNWDEEEQSEEEQSGEEQQEEEQSGEEQSGEEQSEKWPWFPNNSLEKCRVYIEAFGQMLFNFKEQLRDAQAAAAECAKSVHDVTTPAGLREFTAHTNVAIANLVGAKAHLTNAKRFQRHAALSYKLMMKHIGLCLTALGRMPAPGEAVTSTDGDSSFTVSREQIDLGDLTAEEVIEACEGAPKQYAAFLDGYLAELTRNVNQKLASGAYRVINRKSGRKPYRPVRNVALPPRALSSRRLLAKKNCPVELTPPLDELGLYAVLRKRISRPRPLLLRSERSD
ncbi:hypothetical protein N656DRAFT_832827 [Canariomyces notabilis]|uniref:Uncharacterized protein n=1 Tax=Canariomyces notabilis TaxID=2074819 RepID=A0AAN6QDV4_9PEZI|nr:hypothetical protein N656DRAFT_832827 [Canariomyces arenarius]